MLASFSSGVQWREAWTPDCGVVAKAWMSKGECWGTHEQQPQTWEHVSLPPIMQEPQRLARLMCQSLQALAVETGLHQAVDWRAMNKKRV